MTVGIAAISNPPPPPKTDPPQRIQPPTVMFASDRMITVREVFEYDAPRAKLYALNRFCALLIAGETSTQMSVAQATFLEVQSRGITEIKAIAEISGRRLADHKRAMAERTYLQPLGLTLNTFTQRSAEMDRTLVSNLTHQLQSFTDEIGTEAIVAGVEPDSGWPHLYRIDTQGNTWCEDHVGFSAIGIGAPQAETQFMLQRYGTFRKWIDCLLLIHTAKRAAESAPGVGRETDIHLIDPLSGRIEVPDSAIKLLDSFYDARIVEEQRLREEQIPKLETALREWVENEQKNKDNTGAPDKT